MSGTYVAGYPLAYGPVFPGVLDQVEIRPSASPLLLDESHGHHLNRPICSPSVKDIVSGTKNGGTPANYTLWLILSHNEMKSSPVSIIVKKGGSANLIVNRSLLADSSTLARS